jgi:hypothetical protein
MLTKIDGTNKIVEQNKNSTHLVRMEMHIPCYDKQT